MIPPEAGPGVIAATVSFTKGCYTGQELVARLDARGNRVARRLCTVVAEGPEALAPGAAVVAGGGKEAGVVTSAAWSPWAAAPVGLAFIHRSVGEGDVVTVDGRPATVRGVPLRG
jgi:folate-binding Fe-S cluster repair protein YgfZ